MFGCNHKYGEVDGKGYQYCKKCGKANNVGFPPCNHKWGDVATLTKTSQRYGHITGYTYIQKCELCGEMKRFDVDI